MRGSRMLVLANAALHMHTVCWLTLRRAVSKPAQDQAMCNTATVLSSACKGLHIEPSKAFDLSAKLLQIITTQLIQAPTMIGKTHRSPTRLCG